jgi:hypothetical protein
MAETTDIEKKNLEAHVELCAERYRALETQFTEVKKDIHEVKDLAEKTHALVNNMSEKTYALINNMAEKRNTQLINWGIGIIGALVASTVYLLVTYVFK